MSSEAQRAMLEEALLDDAAVHTKLGKLTSHYLAGRHDAACLEVGVESQETDYWRAIVLRRNASWIKAVGALSPGSGHLVAVGLAHTCGQGSLIELMRDAGFSVSRVK
jgi:uncharacterized protein YbaP (TraB family)